MLEVLLFLLLTMGQVLILCFVRGSTKPEGSESGPVCYELTMLNWLNIKYKISHEKQFIIEATV